MKHPHPHPHPWSFRPEDEAYDDEGAFLDADGIEICDFGRSTPYDSVSGKAPAEPYATMMTLAPEMEDILREMYGSQAIAMDGETDEARRHRRDGMRRGFEKIAPLLARIDNARKTAP